MFRPTVRRFSLVVLLALCQVALTLAAAIHHDHGQEPAASTTGIAGGWHGDHGRAGDGRDFLAGASCRLCSWNRTAYRPATASQIRAAGSTAESRRDTVNAPPSRSAAARHVLLRAPPVS